MDGARIDVNQQQGLQPPKQQSLVIEDYYCVSVEAPVVRDAGGVLQLDASAADSRQCTDVDECVPPDQAASFLSEEGPAQWLTTPNSGLDDSDNNLSMESAGETSESDGK